ncbi:MAG TPA: hypothetical protein VH024_16270, partial [Candidatus Angelobacter sp.]|nr:hypothetical protein [Candidatus Angelobacter sp.]
MKPVMLAGAIALIAGSLIGADSRDEIAAAAAKLAASGNYSWTATTDSGPNSQVARGPTEGKVD